jgi:TPR repeat protein
MHSPLRGLLLALAMCTTTGLALASQYEDGVIAQSAGDYAKAMALIRPLAFQGDANAQFRLSLLYGNGQGVPLDIKESLKWLRLAAQKGSSEAQSNLGGAYARGRGVSQDSVRALMWFCVAADAGNKEAITNREVTKARMTPRQIQLATEMANACVQDHFRGCD